MIISITDWRKMSLKTCTILLYMYFCGHLAWNFFENSLHCISLSSGKDCRIPIGNYDAEKTERCFTATRFTRSPLFTHPPKQAACLQKKYISSNITSGYNFLAGLCSVFFQL